MNDEDVVFFVHVMKTAGTSFQFYLGQNVPAARTFPGAADGIDAQMRLDALRAIPQARRAGLRLYFGHFPAFAAEIVGATRTVTVLRDPVERVVSLLKQRQRPANPPTGHWLPRTPHLTLEEIYDDPGTRPWVDNVQARVFAMEPTDDPVTFLDPIVLDRARLDAAKARLASFDVVGVQEDFAGLVGQAQKVLGFKPLVGMPRAFVAEEVPVPDGLRERIAEDMAWDRELYDFAVGLIADRGA